MSQPKQTRELEPQYLNEIEIPDNDTALQFWTEVSGAPQYGSPEQRTKEVLRKAKADKELLAAHKRANELKDKIRADNAELKTASNPENRTKVQREIKDNEEALGTINWPDGRRLPSQRLWSDYEQKALTLDLVYACWPEGYNPSYELVELLKMALGLPKDHEVVFWAEGRKGRHGHFADGRGSNKKQDPDVWQESIDIDTLYFHAHGKKMPVHALQRALDEKFPKRAPSRATLREWRENSDYAREAFISKTRYAVLTIL
jgi:hypothetical protein